jgi:hypothetical protein
MSLLAFWAVLLGSVALSIGAVSCGDAKRDLLAHRHLYTHFAVFNVPSGPDDALPLSLVAVLRGNGQFSAQMSVRRIAAGSNPSWLVMLPSDELCLMQLTYPLLPSVNGLPLSPLPSQACTSEELAETGRLANVQSLASEAGQFGRNVVTGVVPNGVTTVMIKEGDGHMIVAPVTRNGYEVLSVDPHSLEFVSGGHRYDQRLGSFGRRAHYEPPTGGFGPVISSRRLAGP